MEIEKALQWIADNERLVLAAYLNSGPGPLDCDEMTLGAVKSRCIEYFGEKFGSQYYFGLIASFPKRHKELFPEIYGDSK